MRAPKRAAEAAPALAMEEFRIPAVDPGIELYVRNKRPQAMREFPAEKILLYVHGSTYPAETAFDLHVGGTSWMEYIAARGYDVYLVDLRGYGQSTRPPEMAQPPEANPPIVRTDTAVKDVGAAVDFVLKRRGAAKLNLLGWSWGTTIMGWYAAQHPARVNKLVLYAPQWLRSNPSLTDAGGPLGAYRTVSKESARARWVAGVPPEKQAALIPAGWYEAWAEATFATDPVGARQSPPVLRAPNGTVADTREYWASGKPRYNPEDIRVPTLLVHADWDRDLPSEMMHAFMARLVNAPYRRAVEIGEGTHTVLLEKNRMQLFHAVQEFLDEAIAPEG